MTIFLHSREGVTKEDLLSMVAYSICILHLIKTMKAEFPDVPQPVYANDTGELGTFSRFRAYFNSLKRLVPGRGYYPEPSKFVLIVHPENIESGKLFGSSYRFKVYWRLYQE